MVSAATEIVVVLQLAGVVQSVEVEGSIPRMEDRSPGVGTRFTVRDLNTMPTRRSGLFDWIRMAPGISPTSPSSGVINSISSFGSATNENAFLIDCTDFTSPTNGAPRADPGADFIEDVHVQAVGVSVEYGGIQGAVVNAVTKQGGDRFALEASYYGQPASLTGGSVRLPVPGTRALGESICPGRSTVTFRPVSVVPSSAIGRGFSPDINTCGTRIASLEPMPASPECPLKTICSGS